MEVQDTTWNSTLRHSLGKIKNRDDILEFMKKLRKSRKSAFQQQDNLIEHFLYQRHYSSKFIQTYLQTSLLSRITNDSFQNFFDLADAIRQLSIDLPQWEGGPAKAMLDYHASKLWDIRQYAISRKQLILQVYTYLRDAQAKEFHHEAMVGALWERLNDLNSANFGSRVNTGGGAGNPRANNGDNAETRCSHCMLKELHRLANVPGQRGLCPVKDIIDKAKAKEAAKWVVKQKHEDRSKDLKSLCLSARIRFG